MCHSLQIGPKPAAAPFNGPTLHHDSLGQNPPVSSTCRGTTQVFASLIQTLIAPHAVACPSPPLVTRPYLVARPRRGTTNTSLLPTARSLRTLTGSISAARADGVLLGDGSTDSAAKGGPGCAAHVPPDRRVTFHKNNVEPTASWADILHVEDTWTGSHSVKPFSQHAHPSSSPYPPHGAAAADYPPKPTPCSASNPSLCTGCRSL